MFIEHLLTSYRQIVLLPKSYLLFLQNTNKGSKCYILVIPYNNVVRIEDTALK